MGTTTVIAAILVTLAQVGPASAPEAQMQDQIVARVGDQEVSRGDFMAELNRLIPESFFHGNVSAEVRRGLHGQALESLLEKCLIHQEALALGMTASEQEIDEEFSRTLEKAGPRFAALSEKERAALLESYRGLVVRRILRDKNERRFEGTTPEVTEELLQSTYAERKPDLLTVEEARFRHIMANVDPSAGRVEAEAIQKRLESILERLDAGESFEDLAKEGSDDIYAAVGGDMGFVIRGSFRTPTLNQIAFDLEDGQTSPIIASIYGYHLVRRVESHPQRQLTYEEVKDQLADELRVQLAEEARLQWIAGLRETIGVEIIDDPTLWDIAEPAPLGPHGQGHP